MDGDIRDRRRGMRYRMSEQSKMESFLQIRYVKLHFTAVFPEACVVPASKTSALRGGIGEMLLRANCIRNRDCKSCDFIDECIVQRTMYSRFPQKPEFVTGGDSIGYVLECDNYKEEMEAGEQMHFQLILFGKTIVYFSQYLNAIAALGQNGLGKNHARFLITRITNTRKQDILNGSNILMKNYVVEHLSDYVRERRRELEEKSLRQLIFHTATTLKYKGEFLQEFHMEAIILAARRRLYMLNCFEDRQVEDLRYYEFELPEMRGQKVHAMQTRRFSNRQESAMYLKGIKGRVEVAGLEGETLDLLLAAEVFHVGKNTHFGFGQVMVR